MINSISFVTDKTEFDKLLLEAGCIFNLEKRLPDQVFKEGYIFYLIKNFIGDTMSTDFWRYIQHGNLGLNNEVISFLTLDPDPVQYFHKEFSCYSAFQFPLHINDESYAQAFQNDPGHSPADALLFNSTTVIWFPNSLNWGIWAERDLEIAILALKKENSALKKDRFLMDGQWMNIQAALVDILPQVFPNNVVPSDISKKLLENYI
ncbi:MAG: hypothetical protein K0Q50_382 [Vampirovibrio sp.]|jgi:hypothetical protein|nr:hypothetical protein [Vampirovibrio sp.]